MPKRRKKLLAGYASSLLAFVALLWIEVLSPRGRRLI